VRRHGEEAPRWSSAATRPSSSSTTPTSMPRSPARSPRSTATPARPASAPTACWCRTASTTPSPRSSPPPSRNSSLGDGAQDGINMGPLIDEGAVAKVKSFVADAVAKGATRGHRRQAPRARRQLLRAHHPHRRDDRTCAWQRGDLRPGRAGVPLQDRGRGHRAGQRHRVRPRLYFYARDMAASGAWPKRWNTASSASTTGHHLHRGRALRRREGIRPRPRRLQVRHRRLPRDQVPVHGRQLIHFSHTCFQVVAYDGYVRLAERLNALAPGDAPKKTIFMSTGAEAVENAVKIARALHRSPRCHRLQRWLPRPHHDGDGAHRQGGALQDRLRPVPGRRSTTRAFRITWHGVSVDGFAGGHRAPVQVRHRARSRGGLHRRAGAGRGRLHGGAAGVHAGAAHALRRARHPADRRRGAVGLSLAPAASSRWSTTMCAPT
jgi:hypothetical protein